MTHQQINLGSTATVVKATRNGYQSNTLAPKAIVVAILLSAASAQSFAAGYSVKEIPLPNLSKISIPAGEGIRPVCLAINENGQVACNLEIIQTLNRTPLDQLAPNAKIFASYVYTWNSAAPLSATNPRLLSDTSATTFDHAAAINKGGEIAGSTGVATKRQGALWSFNASLPTPMGPGKITALNDNGDYVLNGRLFSLTGVPVNFVAKTVVVDTINNGLAGIPQAAGKEQFAKVAGTGLLYAVAPANPTFALAGTSANETVTNLSDKGNFVISGIPGTLSGMTAVKCNVTNKCQFYVPTVGASSRNTPWLTLNAVDDHGVAVGTDTGIAVQFKPNASTATNPSPADSRIVLNATLTNNTPANSWFLNEATDSNNQGAIIGKAIKGSKTAAFLLTPVL